jgi:hypothetical protein
MRSRGSIQRMAIPVPLNDIERQAALDVAERHRVESDDHLARVRAVIAKRTKLGLDTSADEAILTDLLDKRVVIERDLALLRSQA